MSRAWYAGAAVVVLAGLALTLARPGAEPGSRVPTSPAPRDAGPATFPAGTAGHRLVEYVAGDFAGERLERASWLKYKGWVMWPTEPAWDEAYVVRSYQPGKVTAAGTEATAEVRYETLGILDLATFAYETSPSTQAVPFKLLVSEGAWKIGLPMLRPHPGPEAAIAFLERMKVHFKKQGPTIEKSIAAIRKDAGL